MYSHEHDAKIVHFVHAHKYRGRCFYLTFFFLI